jgi:tetratricopeptide (TPR) repeat protein
MCPTRWPRSRAAWTGIPRAVQYADHSLRFFGNNAAAHYRKAICHYQIREFETALECIDRALETGHDSRAFGR